MIGEAVPARAIWRLSGKDVLSFLQGLVSNDVLPLARAPGLVWAALLSPQGKYLADFFIARPPGFAADEVLLDLPADLADGIIKRLTLYRLRADVRVEPSPLRVSRGLGDGPESALSDPRTPALGWRAYTETAGTAPSIDWNAIRVEHLIPEYPADLVPDDSYILEMGFERLHGVDFRKGCYVGQEVTARMKHKTDLRKGLVRLHIDGHAEPGSTITLPDGREAGRLGTVSGNRALAHLRYDRLDGPLQAGAATLQAEPVAGTNRP